LTCGLSVHMPPGATVDDAPGDLAP
jgi:hypothetical protein